MHCFQFLNKPTSSSGTILFGGIDHGKFQGNLSTLPITSKYVIGSVPSKSATFKGQTFTNSTEPVLDIGSAYSYLPKNIIKGIAQKLNGTYSKSLQTYVIDCDLKNSHDSIKFEFVKGASIDAPLADFVLTVKEYNTQNKRSDQDTCILGIFDDFGWSSLGENFLRNAYLYYNFGRQDGWVSTGYVHGREFDSKCIVSRSQESMLCKLGDIVAQICNNLSCSYFFLLICTTFDAKKDNVLKCKSLNEAKGYHYIDQSRAMLFARGFPFQNHVKLTLHLYS